ncbi:MAG: ABC transporter ATP-binding protein [Lachnospiraceae bacterium]|nr:ABC transporter ATP-binding protein [Lachnospiraceae bacterium]
MKIILKNVTKRIGTNEVLTEVNAEFESGRVYGITGRNGSGKTMLLRVIAGLLRPTMGEILVDDGAENSVGNPPKRLYKDLEVIPKLGIVLENAGLYPEFSGYQNLKFLAGINKLVGEAKIRETIERVGLDPNDKRSIRKYSLGMRQRITLAQAIMEKPDVLLLDEPTNALDETGVELLYKIVREEKERGALVILVSHTRNDIQAVCDCEMKMRSGKLAF